MTPETQLLIRQGTVGRIEDCRIGLSAVDRAGAWAAITVVAPQTPANKCFVSLDVRKDDVVLVCGAFRRVLDVAGGEGGSLVLDRRPVAVIEGGPGTSPRYDVLTLTPGAIARLVTPTGDAMGPFASAQLLEVADESGQLAARFATWPTGGDRPAEAQTVTVRSGAHLVAEGRRHQVRIIAAATPDKGLPAFVELSTTPAP